MAIQYWMNYVIFFQDETEYQLALAMSNGTGLIELAPRDAATLFGISFPYPSGDMSLIPKGIYFITPFTVGANIGFPAPSGVLVDDTVLTVTVPCQATSFSSCPADGSKNGVFTWSGNIILSAGAGSGLSPSPNAISQRRWIWGREVSNFLEGGSGATEPSMCRDSSRTIDGIGYPIRGNTNVGSWTRLVDEYRTGLVPVNSWERFYFRVRALPTLGTYGWWRSQGTGGVSVGIGFALFTDGTLHCVNSAGGDLGVILTSAILELNKWFRADVFLRYNNGPSSTFGVVYINGVNFGTFTHAGGFSTSHSRSQMGRWLDPGTDTTVEIDIDDWISADLPANVNVTTLAFNDANYSLDWITGSHVRLVNTITPSQVNWTPAGMAEGANNQGISPIGRLGNSSMISTTSGASLEGVTDAPLNSVPDSFANVIGAAAAIVGLFSRNSGGTDGQLGYRLAGGAPLLATVNQLAADGVNSVAYLPSAMISPTEIAPFSVVHTKSADGNTDTTSGLVAVVEYLGVFGVEDDPTWTFPDVRFTFLHNNRYPNTGWGFFGSQPVAPVFAVGGTYVGNSSYQEITLPAPCHFMVIRPTTGAPTGGIKFFGASIESHLGAGQKTFSNHRVWYDSVSGTFKFSVIGDSIECNQTAITYQYIAFCDPGMRFNYCGAFSHNSTPSPRANPLAADNFLALCGFFQRDDINIAGNATGSWFKGPGNAASQGNLLSGAGADANIANFAVGILNSLTTLHGVGGVMNTNFSLWRTQDSGLASCAGIGNVMVQILQYTGNGTNPRNISLTPVSGRFPLFALVVPVNATAAFYRDPSHTGSNSCDYSSLANSTLAITGVAMDQITVNSALNANGIVYNVFAICGDSAGNNNGTFNPLYCDGSGPYTDPEFFNGIGVLGNGGLSLDGTPPSTLLRDISGIYTLVTGKRNDTLLDRQTGQSSVDVEIPDPTFKTGYIGG